MDAAVTDSEMIAALEEIIALQEDPEGYYTAQEWADTMECTLATARKRLRAAKALNRLDMRTVRREALDGRALPQPGYRILPAT